MKRFKLAVLIMSATAAVMAAGCDDGNPSTQTIAVSDAAALKQTVYGDSSKGASAISFTTTGAWTSAISDVTGSGSTRMNINNPGEGGSASTGEDWISISPSEGKTAGAYTVAISLKANYSGADRKAKIEIVCGGERITVEVTQSSDKEDGTPMVPTIEELKEQTEKLVEEYEGLFVETEAIFLVIDNTYPTFASRQPVTASTPVLYEFFTEAYKMIRYCNLLIENVDLLDDVSEQDKDVVKGTATMYRAAVHFYLNTLFGGVQLVTSTEYQKGGIARSKAEDVRSFICAELDGAIQMLPAAKANEARLIKLKLFMAQSEYGSAAQVALAMIATGTLAFADSNGDGLTTAADSDALLFAQTYLMAAEAATESGNTEQAFMFIDEIYEPLGMSPITAEGGGVAEQIRIAIRQTYNGWNNGLKFLNEIRWSGEDWGKYTLMPIPQSAIDLDSNLTQNPGWE